MAKGFTLVEALASIVLLGVGIVASQQTIGAIGRNEARSRLKERLESLAQSKLDELLTESGQTPGDQNGDFADRGERDISWTFSVSASGIQNLDTIRLVVTPRREGDDSPRAILSTLRFNAPTTTTGAAP
ncbi:MAG: hypothetical protein C4320_04330 [Armatimonadota bacterium]